MVVIGEKTYLQGPRSSFQKVGASDHLFWSRVQMEGKFGCSLFVTV